MQTIEINTTQNVVIEYELADLRMRGLAFFIDFIIIMIGNLLLYLIYETVIGISPDYFGYLVTIPVVVFYSPAMEYLMKGQSPGKKAMGIKVILLNGEVPGINKYLTRWAFRFIDIYFSLGAIGAMCINSSQKGQRIGDIVAGTVVTCGKSSVSLSLNQILGINTRDTYKPQYPEIKKLKEQDVMLIKQLLDRSRKHPNEAHREAVSLLSLKLKKLLGIEAHAADEDFLRTLINDYIVLTR